MFVKNNHCQNLICCKHQQVKVKQEIIMVGKVVLVVTEDLGEVEMIETIDREEAEEAIIVVKTGDLADVR